MSILEKALEENSIKDLVGYFTEKAKATIDNAEHLRCIATAFYLESYNSLPFSKLHDDADEFNV